MSLFLCLEVGQKGVFVQHAHLFVGITPFEPATLIDTLSVQKDKPKALLVVALVDLLADLAQVHTEYFITGH